MEYASGGVGRIRNLARDSTNGMVHADYHAEQGLHRSLCLGRIPATTADARSAAERLTSHPIANDVVTPF